MKYTLEYLFGFKSKSGKKASLGTIFHKVMELRAQASKAIACDYKFIIDDNFGQMKVSEALNLTKSLALCFGYYKDIESHIVFDDKKDMKTIAGWIEKTLSDYSSYDPINLDIIDTEVFFDFEIKKPWAAYKSVIDGVEFSGNLRIKGTMDTVVRLTDNVYELVDYKGLPIDTPIPTPYGWTTMGDLKVGDSVFDQFGKVTKVTAKSTQKFKECYQIEFDDTSKVICDDEHYWKLADGSVVQVKDLKLRDKINIAQSIECEEKELPIDPYVLGIWLGDGRNREGNITSGDKFIFDEIQRRGFKLGNNTDKSKNNCEAKTVFGLTAKLRTCNLLHNKHIPEVYFRGSYKQRLDLLRGLMDSDGYANPARKQAGFINCREILSKDVKNLLLSLGQRPYLSKVKSSGFGLVVDVYPVYFRPVNINPFLLPTKSNKVDKDWGPGESWRRSIVKIEKIGIKLTQCITVDSPDSTYLCTENMIPTHNTGMMRSDFATGEEKTLEYLQNDVQLLLYLIALTEIYPDKHFILTLFYINNGGLFSVAADDDMLGRAWKMLEKTYKQIGKTYNPSQLDSTHKDWRCKYCCDFSKPYKNGLSMCQFMKKEMREKSFGEVSKEYVKASGITTYGSGGGRSADVRGGDCTTQ